MTDHERVARLAVLLDAHQLGNDDRCLCPAMVDLMHYCEHVAELIVALDAPAPVAVTDDEREALADLLDEIHGPHITEGGCLFGGWRYGWRVGDPATVAPEIDRILAAGFRRSPVTVTDDMVERAARAMYAQTNMLSMSGARDLARAALVAALTPTHKPTDSHEEER